MNAERHPVFTIGHSNLEIGKFVALLKQHGIQAIADVRSSPYSQYNPQFNRELLQKSCTGARHRLCVLGTRTRRAPFRARMLSGGTR